MKSPARKEWSRKLPAGAPALVHVRDAGAWPDLGLAFDEREGVLRALAESRAWFQKKSSKQWFPYRTDDREITHADELKTLQALESILNKSRNRGEFQAWCHLAFDLYHSVGWNGQGEVLFTAYCEPIFEGRLKPEGSFVHPLYRLPPDLVKGPHGKPLGRRTKDGRVVPYFTRRELTHGRHLGGLELVYLGDPFEVYIAQVQGSARIRLKDGRQLSVGYAGKTDRPYKSVGRYLVSKGRIKASELSLNRLEHYFKEHPEELERVLPVNESFVFFMERPPGPFGSLGTRVTAYHSLATDKSIFPRGGPCLVETRLPVSAATRGDGTHRLTYKSGTLLAFDQDTGGAIRSAGRADLFVGTGPKAQQLAGYTREQGRLFYLFVKPRPVLP